MREIEFEKDHLAQVVFTIQGELDKITAKIKTSKSRVLSTRKYMWEEMPRLIRDASDANELTQGLLELKHQEDSLGFYLKEEERLKRLKYSPYFACIDFKIKDVTQKIYIGVSGFRDPQGKDNLIYDWRSPIASLFYDYPLGEASYLCEAGRVFGTLTFKRQFRIEKSQMIYMFDSSLNIEDEMLQEILSQSTDGQMREIVMTIQKEQNRAIRDEAHRLVLVWGAGGSGKTSIALHRIAYLLYSRKSQLNAGNIVIFSPSDIFQDYISEVLPSLGEKNVKQSTFHSLAQKIVNLPDYTLENTFERYEYLFSDTGDLDLQIRLEAVRFKSSPQFLLLLENYLTYLENSYNNVEDFVYNGTLVLAGEEISSCIKEKYNYLPFQKRLEKLARRLNALLEPLEIKRQEVIFKELLADNFNPKKSEKQLQKIAYRKTMKETAKLKDRMAKLVEFNLVRFYLQLFEDDNLISKLAVKKPERYQFIARQTLALFKNGYLTYEDLTALTFLKLKVAGFEVDSSIKHVVIDEVQDYSAIELKVLTLLYSTSTFTVLGDPNQALFYFAKPKEYVLNTLGKADSTVLELVKSYRSTEQITTFAKVFTENSEIEPVLRKGQIPEVIISKDMEADLLSLLKRLKYKNIAIITKTFAEATALAEKLTGSINLSVIGQDTELLPKGIAIIPVCLAKGLEFDVAVVWKFDHYLKKEQRLLYIAATRALHELYFLGTKKGDLLKKADPHLYHLTD